MMLNAIFSALLVSHWTLVDASISLGTCSLSCNEEGISNAQLFDNRSIQRVPGPPGKSGATGPRGYPGPPGERGLRGASASPCNCSKNQVLEARVETLESLIGNLSQFVRIITSGWDRTGEFYYKSFSETVDYETAQSRCKEQGARLASAGLRDPTFRREIIRKHLQPANAHHWIGLDDFVTQNEWVWSDGEVSTPRNADWSPGEPNRQDEHCALMHARLSFRLVDIACSISHAYLCEYTAP